MAGGRNRGDNRAGAGRRRREGTGVRAERRQDVDRAVEQSIGGRENPDGVRKGMPMKCKKPLKSGLGHSGKDDGL